MADSIYIMIAITATFRVSIKGITDIKEGFLEELIIIKGFFTFLAQSLGRKYTSFGTWVIVDLLLDISLPFLKFK